MSAVPATQEGKVGGEPGLKTSLGLQRNVKDHAQTALGRGARELLLNTELLLY